MVLLLSVKRAISGEIPTIIKEPLWIIGINPVDRVMASLSIYRVLAFVVYIELLSCMILSMAFTRRISMFSSVFSALYRVGDGGRSHVDR